MPVDRSSDEGLSRGVALDTVSRDLHASLSTIQWVSTGYLLSLATVIPRRCAARHRLRQQVLVGARRDADRADPAGVLAATQRREHRAAATPALRLDPHLP
jgi:hypothetical protein